MLVVKVGESVLFEFDFPGADNQPMPATGVAFKAKRPVTGTVLEGTVEANPGTPRAFVCSVVANEPGVWSVYASCAGPTPSFTPTYHFRAEPLPF